MMLTIHGFTGEHNSPYIRLSMLETFRLAKFRFTICARDHIRFPAYKGAAFRGGFGYAFKRVVCVTKNRECDDCLLKQKCIYSYIFETPPPQDTENFQDQDNLWQAYDIQDHERKGNQKRDCRGYKADYGTD